VWNEAEDAQKSIKRLKEKVITPYIIKNDPKLQAKYGEVKLQYNWGQGAMLDVLETYYQLKVAGQVNNYQFYSVIAILTKGNPILTIGAVSTQLLMEPFTRSWEQGNVDEMWQKYYDESFKLSHKVLLVSHSQGNLFANRVYDNINPTEYKNYFANLQVASPASEVKASKGDYVTLSTDLSSFDPVINFIPGSMSPNASGESGHAFVSAYLSQADPLSKITTKMKQLLSNLDTEPSQWETDQELNKNTKEYRITVKHRFDSSIIAMNGIEVYPFAPSKKLYYVQGEFSENISGYVKASCGGYLLEDTWVGQVATEFKRLVHTDTTLPHEIISYKCPWGYTSNGSGCEVKLIKLEIHAYLDGNWYSGPNGFISFTMHIDGKPDGSAQTPPLNTTVPNSSQSCRFYGSGYKYWWYNVDTKEITYGGGFTQPVDIWIGWNIPDPAFWDCQGYGFSPSHPLLASYFQSYGIPVQ